MNRGDAQIISLSINIDGEPISEGYADDIELTFNAQSGAHCVKKKLKNGTIAWDAANNRYAAYLSQEDTFRFTVGDNKWQLRLLKGNIVISTQFGTLSVGDANSKEVLV